MSCVSAIGLMSGTSYDGVDVALIETDGEEIGRSRPDRVPALQRRGARRCCGARSRSADQSRRSRRAAQDPRRGRRAGDRHARRGGRSVPGRQRHGGERRSRWSASTARPSCTTRPRPHGPARRRAGARRAGSAFPWCTTFAPPTSRPAGRARRSCRCSIAPWCACSSAPHPIAVLNIGGVANLTFIDGEAELIACDIGPGNALIDDFVRLRTGQPHDDDGRAAAAGQVDEDAVERVLTHPFFAKPPPKSLDRNAFRHWIAGGSAARRQEPGGWRRDADRGDRRGGRALRSRCCRARRRAGIVAGGGIRNPTLMRMLAQRLAPVERRDRRCGRLVGRCARGAGASPIWRCAASRACRSRFRPPPASRPLPEVLGESTWSAAGLTDDRPWPRPSRMRGTAQAAWLALDLEALVEIGADRRISGSILPSKK